MLQSLNNNIGEQNLVGSVDGNDDSWSTMLSSSLPGSTGTNDQNNNLGDLVNALFAPHQGSGVNQII